jgi:shikimate dehydrogenase
MGNDFGLIGFPLHYSFSPKWFESFFIKNNLANCTYSLFPLDSVDDLTNLLDTKHGLKGLNVTIPYKEQVFPFLDFISDEAKLIGAVNCIKIKLLDNEVRELHGYNTDAIGFEHSLLPLLSSDKKYKALVFGSGGAAKAVIFTLQKLGIAFKQLGRENKSKTNVISYTDLALQEYKEHKIWINTTPIGTMGMQLDSLELPYSIVDSEHILYDLVYNPPLTEFMKRGLDAGAKVKNGLEMLEIQAYESAKIFGLI